jgi:hypothetical protein
VPTAGVSDASFGDACFRRAVTSADERLGALHFEASYEASQKRWADRVAAPVNLFEAGCSLRLRRRIVIPITTIGELLASCDAQAG